MSADPHALEALRGLVRRFVRFTYRPLDQSEGEQRWEVRCEACLATAQGGEALRGQRFSGRAVLDRPQDELTRHQLNRQVKHALDCPVGLALDVLNAPGPQQETIPIGDWAARRGVDEQVARRWARAGRIQATREKRGWRVPEDEPRPPALPTGAAAHRRKAPERS